MKPDSLRVHAPTSVVFLCGGLIEPALSSPVMLRDAFFRIARSTTLTYKVVLAEDAEPLTADAAYRDLFMFESDIAQVVGLILLFAESPGSLAELGAFAALRTVAPSLLAVLDDYYYEQVSFIRNGPVRFLENEHGEEWILVLDRKDVGMDERGRISSFNRAALSAALLPAIERRLAARPAWQKFDRENSGHAIMLMTGLCQEFGALTISEIKEYLATFGLINQRLTNYIYCAQLLGWLQKVRKGNHIFYVASPGEPALDYNLEANIVSRDKLRWRSDVRAHWQKNDPARHRAITDVVTAAAGVS